MFERYIEKSRRVIFFARRDAARRIVAALGHEKVRIEVTSPEDSFTVSFDTMTPA